MRFSSFFKEKATHLAKRQSGKKYTVEQILRMVAQNVWNDELSGKKKCMWQIVSRLYLGVRIQGFPTTDFTQPWCFSMSIYNYSTHSHTKNAVDIRLQFLKWLKCSKCIRLQHVRAFNLAGIRLAFLVSRERQLSSQGNCSVEAPRPRASLRVPRCTQVRWQLGARYKTHDFYRLLLRTLGPTPETGGHRDRQW